MLPPTERSARGAGSMVFPAAVSSLLTRIDGICLFL